MEIKKPNWTRKDLKAYLLLFAANADFVEKKEEKDWIRSKVGREEFNHIHEEFDNDSDYQRIQKIENYISNQGYTEEEIDRLLEEIKEVFNIDGEYKAAERTIFFGLRQLLK